MFSIEYKQSRGAASEYSWYENVIDMYILYRDNEKIYSIRPNWTDYYFLIEINNLDEEITILKHGEIYDKKFECLDVGLYSVDNRDYSELDKQMILDYIQDIKIMLDIQNYYVRIF